MDKIDARGAPPTMEDDAASEPLEVWGVLFDVSVSADLQGRACKFRPYVHRQPDADFMRLLKAGPQAPYPDSQDLEVVQ